MWTCSVWCLKFFIKKLKRKIYQSYLNCAWLATRVLQFLLEHLMLWSPWILSLWSAKSLLDQVDVCSQISHGKLKNNVFETMGWIFLYNLLFILMLHLDVSIEGVWGVRKWTGFWKPSTVDTPLRGISDIDIFQPQLVFLLLMFLPHIDLFFFIQVIVA